MSKSKSSDNGPEQESSPWLFDSAALAEWVESDLKRIGVLAFSALAGFAAIYNLLISVDFWHYEQVHKLQILYATQVIIVSAIAIITTFGKGPPRYEERYKRGSQAVQQFWSWWSILWAIWALLYAALFFSKFLPTPGEQGEGVIAGLWFIPIVLHALNNAATLVIMMLFYILSQPSVPIKVDPEGNIFRDVLDRIPDEKKKLPNVGAAPMAKLIFWVILVFIAQMGELVLFWMAETEWQASGDDILLVFGIAYGVLAATATALVIGQLDTKLLGVPTGIIVFLFMYAAIQPNFDFIFKEHGNEIRFAAQSVLISLALISKLFLFLTVRWLVVSNRLLYYMVENYNIYVAIEQARTDFQEDLEGLEKQKTRVAGRRGSRSRGGGLGRLSVTRLRKILRRSPRR